MCRLLALYEDKEVPVMVWRIIYQQVRQVMWQILACLGLVMILPIEEAIVNFRDGDDFYSIGMAVFGP